MYYQRKSQRDFDAELKLKPKKLDVPLVEPKKYVRDKPMPAYVSRKRGADDYCTPEEVELMKGWMQVRETKELYKYMERKNGDYSIGH